jgi:hypothetical protein
MSMIRCIFKFNLTDTLLTNLTFIFKELEHIFLSSNNGVDPNRVSYTGLQGGEFAVH